MIIRERKDYLDKEKSLIYYYTDWCSFCIKIHNEVEKIAKQFENDIDIYFINQDDYSKEEIDFFNIPKSVPTLYGFLNGIKVFFISGGDRINYEILEALINTRLLEKDND